MAATSGVGSTEPPESGGAGFAGAGSDDRVRFDPLERTQLENPYPVYAQLRHEYPVFYAENYGFWVVTRYDDVVTASKSHRSFSSVNALTSVEPPPEVRTALAEGYPEMPIITACDPPLHDKIRGLVNKTFTPRRVAEMEPRIRAISQELIDGFAADGRADVVHRFAWPMPLIAIADLVGVPRDDLDFIHVWTDDWLRMLQGAGTLDQQIEFARNFVRLQEYFMDALEARDEHPGDDLMTAMYQVWREGDTGLTLPEVMGVPLDLIIAGHVTVTRAIGSALVLLLQHPEALEALRRDESVVPNAVEEILRAESPAQGLFRLALDDVELGGVTIPRGAKVMLHYGAANRDEAYFGEPDRFDVHRAEADRHLAFGKGIHFCLGAPLARLELKVALPMLLDRLPNLRFAGERPFDRAEVFFARGLSRLELEWDVG
jgi:cytochrome P450